MTDEQFEELMSLYLDNEADDSEKSALAKEIRTSRLRAEIFCHACRIHAAGRRLYGKPVEFQPLEGVDMSFLALSPQKLRRKRLLKSWSVVGIAAMLCAVSAWFAFADKPDVANSKSDKATESTLAETERAEKLRGVRVAVRKRYESCTITTGNAHSVSQTTYTTIRIMPKNAQKLPYQEE